MRGVIYSSLWSFRIFAQEYRWNWMGNVLGDYGECVAVARYGLGKARQARKGTTSPRKTARRFAIKANHASQSIGFRDEADLLL